MRALALLMELGPRKDRGKHTDRGKLRPGWELNPRPSGLKISTSHHTLSITLF